jgi:hypothetical protein
MLAVHQLQQQLQEGLQQQRIIHHDRDVAATVTRNIFVLEQELSAVRQQQSNASSSTILSAQHHHHDLLLHYFLSGEDNRNEK